MSFDFVEKYQAMSGKWIVRVILTDTETVFLNFNTDPTQDEIDQASKDYLSKLAEFIQMIPE